MRVRTPARPGTIGTRPTEIFPLLYTLHRSIIYRSGQNLQLLSLIKPRSSTPSATQRCPLSNVSSQYINTRRRTSQGLSLVNLATLRSNHLAGVLFLRSAAHSARGPLPTAIALQSSLYHPTVISAAAAALAFAIAYLLVTGESTGLDIQPSAGHLPLDDMPHEIAPGHLGNLTAEQEDKLRQLWEAVFKVCGVSDSSDANPAPKKDEKPGADAEITKKKRGFSFFRSAPQSAHASSNGNNATDSADDDKYGLTKQYQEILANQKPEEIRETMWAMMKHDHPDALLLRFLRARKWDVEKALIMLISAMNWRHTKMKVDQDIMKNGEAGAAADEKNGDEKAKKLGQDFLKQSRMGKSFLHGTDKEGRPICIVRVCLHKAGDQSPESLERYTVFIIETARLALKPPVDTANIIFDMTGFTLANMDYHPVKFMIQCFEANYPESLGVVLVHNAPWLFQGIWRVIRGWLDPVVAAKVHFTNYRTGLEEFIRPCQLIKDLEGDEDWTYAYEEPIEGENDLMKDTTTRDRLLKEREKLYAQYEAATRRWTKHASGEEAEAIKAERDDIAAKLRDGYWQLDPYVRARSLYDRQGVIRSDGDVNWYRNTDSKSTPSTGIKSGTETAANAVD